MSQNDLNLNEISITFHARRNISYWYKRWYGMYPEDPDGEIKQALRRAEPVKFRDRLFHLREELHHGERGHHYRYGNLVIVLNRKKDTVITVYPAWSRFGFEPKGRSRR